MTAEAIDTTTARPAAPRAVPNLAYVPVQVCQCGHGQAEHTLGRSAGEDGRAAGCLRFRRRAGRPARATLRR